MRERRVETVSIPQVRGVYSSNWVSWCCIRVIESPEIRKLYCGVSLETRVVMSIWTTLSNRWFNLRTQSIWECEDCLDKAMKLTKSYWLRSQLGGAVIPKARLVNGHRSQAAAANRQGSALNRTPHRESLNVALSWVGSHLLSRFLIGFYPTFNS